MAVNVDNAFIRTFEGVVRFLAQQSQNKLRGWCQERNQTGEDHVFETLAPAEMQEKTGRRQATPENDSDWQNRIVLTKTFDIGDTMEKEDKLRMIIEPTSAIAQNHAMAGRRKFDDIIIDAAEAAALDKDGNSNAFPAGQIIRTGGASEISFDVVTEIQEGFQTNDIDIDEPKVAVVGPKQIRKLMHDPKATSADYATLKAIQAGRFHEEWMGFRWVVTNRLNSPGAGRLNNLFFTRKALGLKVDEDINSDIAKDPSKSFMWRIYTRLTAGAVRVEDKHIFIFDAKNTVTIA